MNDGDGWTMDLLDDCALQKDICICIQVLLSNMDLFLLSVTYLTGLTTIPALHYIPYVTLSEGSVVQTKMGNSLKPPICRGY